MNEIYIAVKAMLINLFPSYDPAKIYQMAQNNMTLPDDVFIIMRGDDSDNMMMIPEYKYDATNEVSSYTGLDSTKIYIDFYGAGGDALAKTLRLYLSTFDCTDFLATNHNMSIHEVKKERNLTEEFDRGKYLQHYVVEFSIFAINALAISSLGFSSAEVGVILADVQ